MNCNIAVFRGTFGPSFEDSVEITPSSVASKVRIVNRRAYADWEGGTSKRVAHVVSQVFDCISHVSELFVVLVAVFPGEDFIDEKDIVSWPSCAFDRDV